MRAAIAREIVSNLLVHREFRSAFPAKLIIEKDSVKVQVQKLIDIVRQLVWEFPGKHFALDSHLVGSIGEVMEAYYYRIELYAASVAVHDGEIDGRKVQIKMSQQDNIVINHEPEFLIVMYLNKSGNVYEVYSCSGKAVEPCG